MAFDLNAVPPGDRSPAQMTAHLEMYKRSMDTIRVHNPTDEDYIVYNDRKVTNEQYVIPNKNRDVGYGKGNMHVFRYIADRYVNKMGTKMIMQIAKEDWDKQKLKYRREEWGTYEERLAIKPNDPKQWEKIAPQLFLGVVSRYQMNEPEPLEQTPEKSYNSRAEAALERLGIADQQIEEAKDEFINSIT